MNNKAIFTLHIPRRHIQPYLIKNMRKPQHEIKVSSNVKPITNLSQKHKNSNYN